MPRSTKPSPRAPKATARAGAKKRPIATLRAARTAHKRPLKGSRNDGTVPLPEFTEPLASKKARLIAMLKSASGATIEQMKTLTGWQADTLRGTISGVLRKRLGFNVVSNALIENGARTYRIVAAQASE
jgi:hypothetical protein